MIDGKERLKNATLSLFSFLAQDVDETIALLEKSYRSADLPRTPIAAHMEEYLRNTLPDQGRGCGIDRQNGRFVSERFAVLKTIICHDRLGANIREEEN